MNPREFAGIPIRPMHAPDLILLAAAVYVAAGLAVGIPFVCFGVATIDHAAGGAGWHFRLLILPGSIALWPLMLAKWRRAASNHPSGSTP